MNDASPIPPANTSHEPAHELPAHELLEWWRRRGEPFFDRFGGAIAMLLILTAAAAMLAWTWLRWADPIVNCGRELYIPWQLASGRVLYRDIPHFNGPFSQYFNAMLFFVVGPSVRALVLTNLLWLAALVAMTWRLWRLIADRFTATVACLLLLLMCSFIQLTRTGGFNFVMPFAHEMTHGAILSFAAITCLAAYLRGGKRRWLLAAGFALGLVFLTRAEMFVAAAPAVMIGAIASMYARRLSNAAIARHLGELILATIVPPIVALLLLNRAMPLEQALHGVLGSWRWSFDERLIGNTFYETLRGTDWPARNLAKMLFCSVGYVVLLGSAAAAGMFFRRPGEIRAVAPMLAALLVVSALVIVYDTLNWQYVLCGLNVVMVALALGFGAMLLQRPRDRIDAVLVLRLTVVWFALLLLARMGLRVVIFDFGFVIAMPALLAATAAAVCWLPNVVHRNGGARWVGRMAALAALAVLTVRYLEVFGENFNGKPIVVGSGADALRFDRVRGTVLRDMLEQIDRRLDLDDTLAVMPEGAFVNYFARRANPAGYANLMPPEIIMFGGAERVRDRFRRTPPDWIVVTFSNPESYGYKSFASDYGKEVWAWAAANYHEVVSVGNNRVFFMRLFERNGHQSDVRREQ
jgi:hypothetical protein